MDLVLWNVSEDFYVRPVVRHIFYIIKCKRKIIHVLIVWLYLTELNGSHPLPLLIWSVNRTRGRIRVWSCPYCQRTLGTHKPQTTPHACDVITCTGWASFHPAAEHRIFCADVPLEQVHQFLIMATALSSGIRPQLVHYKQQPKKMRLCLSQIPNKFSIKSCMGTRHGSTTHVTPVRLWRACTWSITRTTRQGVCLAAAGGKAPLSVCRHTAEEEHHRHTGHDSHHDG